MQYRGGYLFYRIFKNIIEFDQYGYILNYYQGDYKGAGTITFDPDVTATVANQSGFYKTSADLYNGNIRSMTVAIKQLTNPRAYKYKYDQLNRITALDSTWTGSTLTALPNTWTKSLNHAERITYDPNGNIKTYQRYQQTAALMDNLTYNYYSGKNQLQRVNDAIAAATFTTDIDDQATAVNGGDNYIYDGVGNLVKDTSEALNVTWSPYGKVLSAIRKRTVAPAVDIQTLYGYDPMQNRVLKTYINGTDTTKTYYLRDAQGNTLAVYTRRKDSLVLAEMHLFGSSRLGTWEPNQRLTPSVDTTKKWQLVDGQRRYELTNHLGNVLVTLNDRKQGFNFTAGSYTFFEAVTIQATDYYPFGLEMPGRTFQAANTSAYRFGFNDKENDRGGSWSSTQLVQDYGMRLYNPALGKFLSVDPLASKYPWLTPYQFAGNTPIWAIDLDGLEPAFTTSSPAARDDALRNPIKPYVEPTYQGNGGNPLQEVVVTATRLNVKDVNSRKNVQSLNDGSGGITFTQGNTRIYQYNLITGSRYYAQAPGRATEMVRDDGQKHNEYLQNLVRTHEMIAYTNVTLIEAAFTMGGPTIAQGAFYRSSSLAYGRASAALLKTTQLEVKAAMSFRYAFGFERNAISLAKTIRGKHLMSDKNWKATFQKVINDPKSEIHFSLDDIDEPVMKMIQTPGRSSTNWEMSELYQVKGAFERTFFYHNGSIYKGYDVFKIKPF